MWKWNRELWYFNWCLRKLASDSCDCVVKGREMIHEELCCSLDKDHFLIKNNKTGMYIESHLKYLFFLHPFMSFHSTHVFNVWGQINWLPAAEDTYLPASQLCIWGLNTEPGSTSLHRCLTVSKKKEPTLEQHQQTAVAKHRKDWDGVRWHDQDLRPKQCSLVAAAQNEWSCLLILRASLCKREQD